MVYQVAMIEVNTGKRYVRSVYADNYPNAVKDAMHRLAQELEPPVHLKQDNRRYAPLLPRQEKN